MKLYRSNHKDIELPRLDLLTLLFESKWSAADENTEIHIDAADPSNSITKAQARDVTQRVAYVLRNRYGIGANSGGEDVVVSVSSGNPFIPVLFYSIVAAGGVYSGASTSFTVPELFRQIKDADAKVLLCSLECEPQMFAAAKERGIPLDRVLILDSRKAHDWKLLSAADRSNVVDLSDGPRLAWKKMTTEQELRDTTTCLLYSSGTTGLPKGVRLSHQNINASIVCATRLTARWIAERKKQGKPFRFTTIGHLPMAHVGGITWYCTIPFQLGGSVYWIEKYDFDKFIEYHRRYRLTVQWSVPPIWLSIAKSPKVTDHFDSLEIACSGAAPMGPELAREASRRLGRGRTMITQLYGSTETAGSVTGVDWDDPDQTCSQGTPFPNTVIRFVDDKDNDVEEGQPGEILAAGPLVCQGYHNRPQANKSSFLNGFYRTGDIGVWRNGRIYIVDRRKELIKYKGLQVAPAELEALLISHPKIDDAAVIGVWDGSQATEVPRAYVVVKPEINLKAREVVEFVAKNLSNHKRLRGGVVFVKEIAKSPSGKILRKELRQQVATEEAAKAKL